MNGFSNCSLHIPLNTHPGNIFALSGFGHTDHAIAPAHVPVNAAGIGSRCFWPANLQRQIRVALGIVAIGVAGGNDLQLVAVQLFRPVRVMIPI